MTLPTEDSDEKILALLDKFKADTGEVPGRNEVKRLAECGSPRAGRLRQKWIDTRGVTLPAATYQPPVRAASSNGNGHSGGPDPVDQAVTIARTGPLVVDRAEAGPRAGNAVGPVRSQLGDTLSGLGMVQAEVDREPKRTSRTGEQPDRSPSGVLGFYIVAGMSLLVSADTSWRFFGEVLGITNPLEHTAMFAIIEAALIACGWAMRGAVRGPTHKPGPTRMVLWTLCGLSAYMAMDLSGLVPGLARVALGPLLGVVMLHLALGVEIRHTRKGDTTWSKVGREYRERFLSRVGLADDGRDALARTRERAALRVAHLARASRFTPFRKVRLRRNRRLANTAHDPAQRARMLAELAEVEHTDALRDLKQPSPWTRD